MKIIDKLHEIFDEEDNNSDFNERENKYLRIVDFIIGFAIGLICMFLFYQVQFNKVENTESLFEVKITNDYLNIRKDHSTNAKKLYEALENEKYEVIEVYDNYDSDPYYVWYKVKFSQRRVGWLANYREEFYEERGSYLEIVK